MNKKMSRIERYEEAVNFVSNFNDIFYQTISHNLGSHIEDALHVSSKSWENFMAYFFLKFGNLGDDVSDDMDSTSEDDPAAVEFHRQLDELRKKLSNPVVDTPPILPDVEMTPVDQSVTPKNS
ncbi:hypothetical protein GLOIN_2v1479735 [Rhizophagus irregularis DAOM 181602=DAOM 197198]|nr:hypothetical protein GLOIN_2v1479735 [Rhizophagus irregularis DAOM 181602=DAOM 197198]